MHHTTAPQQLCTNNSAHVTLPLLPPRSAPRCQSVDSSFSRRDLSTTTMASSRHATTRPTTSITSHGELAGYQTTNAAKHVANPLVGGPAAPGTWAAATARGEALGRGTGEHRYNTMPRAMAPSSYGIGSTYTRDFGEDCSDPLDRSAPVERFQTRLASTRELADGTTRNTNNPPGGGWCVNCGLAPDFQLSRSYGVFELRSSLTMPPIHFSVSHFLSVLTHQHNYQPHLCRLHRPRRCVPVQRAGPGAEHGP